MEHLYYLCLLLVMLSLLFIAALWSPVGKGLTSWLLFVMFNCVLSLSHVVSCVRCGTCLYRFLVFATFITLLGIHLNTLKYNVGSRKLETKQLCLHKFGTRIFENNLF